MRRRHTSVRCVCARSAFAGRRRLGAHAASGDAAGDDVCGECAAELSQAIDWIVAEVAAADGYVEAHYDAPDGMRRVPVLAALDRNRVARMRRRLASDDVLLVTGGGKGIAAECALDLAKRYGVRLALHWPLARRRQPRRRADVANDQQLDENLLRFIAAGVTYRYVSADVTDAAAVRAAVEEIGRTLGPVTAILHGAGGNVPQSLRTLDEAAARATLAPKIDGLRNVLAAVDPNQLRLLVTFGSIIARTGLHGEADYALANEWLTALTDEWRREHPHCRCLAVEWSVWSGVGMGERLGRIDALRRQGITPIGPDEGVRILRQLIARRPPKQRPSSSAAGLAIRRRCGTSSRNCRCCDSWNSRGCTCRASSLICDVTLSLGADPYLRDHAYQDTPLLPAVMGLEAMAQISMALSGSNDAARISKMSNSRGRSPCRRPATAAFAWRRWCAVPAKSKSCCAATKPDFRPTISGRCADSSRTIDFRLQRG